MHSDLQDSGWGINSEGPFSNKTSVIFIYSALEQKSGVLYFDSC